jgi:hypothetical protein
MHNCGLNDDNVGPLFFGVFKYSTLRKLNLSKNLITDAGLIKIANHMKDKGDGDLHNLDLGSNDEFTDKGCKPFVEAMLANKELRKLSLRGADCTSKSFEILYKAMVRDKVMPQLAYLNLEGTVVAPDLIEDLNEIIRR